MSWSADLRLIDVVSASAVVEDIGLLCLPKTISCVAHFDLVYSQTLYEIHDPRAVAVGEGCYSRMIAMCQAVRDPSCLMLTRWEQARH